MPIFLPKYFGKGKRGITVYIFLDDTHKLFYSVVISSFESQAAYVIDGLMHNDVVQSNIHSTDTAGYSEILLAVPFTATTGDNSNMGNISPN